ncbi:glucosyltransferase domain-containing protein [Pseudomonas sp. S75]|uniref:glucosyltransferase domain-containing protein n=1 Tax=unclassified Pseudomonas TaxID=196821 RepID=UPI001903F448|nr:MULTISPECIES: glucosyltransferase domain-containing protein [unclassified Pseudomonas]MBJ9975814.1 glucosyltransferase domain-containing protein [Pseudomonas sp. S30]MBK0154772.1 glucosyltransferase domain-containing protein [Pseudomonas sp. S75]
MSSSVFWNRNLTPQEVWFVCLVAIGLHLLPLILVDYAYIDDIWRSQTASITNGSADSWVVQGRVLTEVLHLLLGFSAAGPNLFPLPLLLAWPLIAAALARLAMHYYPQPRLTHVLVVLPLWFNPFFLQNLSYQYDAPAMGLALAACAWAIALGAKGWRSWWLGGLLIGVACSLYQVSINVYVGLTCLEIMRRVVEGSRAVDVFKHLVARAGQFLAGCVIYLLTAHQLVDVPRSAMLPLDARWLAEMQARLQITSEHVALLLTPGTIWLCWTLIGLALAMLTVHLVAIARSSRPVWERWCLGVALLLPVPVSLVMVSGMALLFAEFNPGARLLMGFGPSLVILLWLAHDALQRVHSRLSWVIALPVLFMLSFSFAYGRVLVQQKELQRVVSFSLAHELQVQPTLRDADHYYLLGYDADHSWVPAASGSFKAMPALEYVLNIHFMILPEMMPRVGIKPFQGEPPLDRQQLQALAPRAVVNSEFFTIYRIEQSVYVVMNLPHDLSSPSL